MSCSKAGKHCPHQRLVVRDCPDPLSTIKLRENGPGSSRARARLKATKQRGFRLRDSGTVQVAGLLLKAATTSCLGMRTPLRRKLCRMAPQDAAMHATSCLKSSSTPADEASWCMWDKTQCQALPARLPQVDHKRASCARWGTYAEIPPLQLPLRVLLGCDTHRSSTAYGIEQWCPPEADLVEPLAA